MSIPNAHVCEIVTLRGYIGSLANYLDLFIESERFNNKQPKLLFLVFVRAGQVHRR